MQDHSPGPALRRCGCYGACSCPAYALAATGFFAVVAMVLMSPLFLALPDLRPDAAEVQRMVGISLGVFLVLGMFQFAIIVLAMLIAALADRQQTAARIWGLGKVIVGMVLGSGGGVATMLLLWGLVTLA